MGTGAIVTVLDDVEHLIRSRAPEAVCDDCVTELLELTIRQHANHKTRRLAEAPMFDRRPGECSVCKKTKRVIRYAL